MARTVNKDLYDDDDDEDENDDYYYSSYSDTQFQMFIVCTSFSIQSCSIRVCVHVCVIFVYLIVMTCVHALNSFILFSSLFSRYQNSNTCI